MNPKLLINYVTEWSYFNFRVGWHIYFTDIMPTRQTLLPRLVAKFPQCLNKLHPGRVQKWLSQPLQSSQEILTRLPPGLRLLQCHHKGILLFWFTLKLYQNRYLWMSKINAVLKLTQVSRQFCLTYGLLIK